MRYKFANVSGSTPFFTVNLAERRTNLLVRHIDDLRATMKMVNDAHPFAILAAKKKRLAFARARSQNALPGKNSNNSTRSCSLMAAASPMITMPRTV